MHLYCRHLPHQRTEGPQCRRKPWWQCGGKQSHDDGRRWWKRSCREKEAWIFHVTVLAFRENCLLTVLSYPPFLENFYASSLSNVQMIGFLHHKFVQFKKLFSYHGIPWCGLLFLSITGGYSCIWDLELQNDYILFLIRYLFNHHRRFSLRGVVNHVLAI